MLVLVDDRWRVRVGWTRHRQRVAEDDASGRPIPTRSGNPDTKSDGRSSNVEILIVQFLKRMIDR